MDPPLCGSTSMSHNECTIRALMEPQEASPRKQEMHVLGIDIAKRGFHMVGMDERGKIALRKRLSRHDLMPCIAKLPPCASVWKPVAGPMTGRVASANIGTKSSSWRPNSSSPLHLLYLWRHLLLALVGFQGRGFNNVVKLAFYVPYPP